MNASIFAAMASARAVMGCGYSGGFRLGGSWWFGRASPMAAR
jgi:hypothetical protein